MVTLGSPFIYTLWLGLLGPFYALITTLLFPPGAYHWSHSPRALSEELELELLPHCSQVGRRSG